MRAPRSGWLLASVGTLGLLALAAAASTLPVDTLAIDLRHRVVAATQGSVGSTGAAAPAVGVNVFLEQEVEPDKRQRTLDLIRAAGMTTIRQQIPWEQIEPVGRGQFVDPKFDQSTWDKFDDIVERSRATGLRVILRLDTSPRWALPPSAPDGLGPPVHDEDYWDFVQTVADRYRGRVYAYQVWNEPNLTSEWGHLPPSPEAYVRLLRGASQRIRAADPNAIVVMAALAPTLTDNADAEDDLRYLQAVYDAGGRGAFDVLGAQVYGLRGGPDDPRIDRTDVTFSRPILLREVMERNGDAATHVWATEMGWNANPPTIVEQHFGRVTPTLQARYTVRGVRRIGEQWPWMDLVCLWFFKRTDETNRHQDWFWFRLADPDFTLQPVYYAVRDAANAGWR